MADRFTSVISVTALAAGASIAVAHNIVRGGVAVVPQIVMPDRNTPIIVSSVTTTVVNFTNNGASAATASWLCEWVFSTQATPSQIAPGIYWQGGSSGSGPSAAGISTRIFYINNKITDSATYAAAGIFHDTGSCMTWIAANVTAGYAVELRFCPTDQGSPHVITATGWVVSDTRDIIWSGSGGQYGACELSIPAAVVLPAGDSSLFFPTLTIRDVYLTQQGNFTIGAERQLNLENMTWNCLDDTKRVLIDDCFVSALDCVFTEVQFADITTANSGVFLVGGDTRTRKSQIFMDSATATASFKGATIRLDMLAAGNSVKLVRSTAGSSVEFYNSTMFIQQQTTVAAATIIDTAVGITTCRGLTIAPYLSGTGTVTFLNAGASLNAVPGPIGYSAYMSTGAGQVSYPANAPFILVPPTTTLDGAAPAFAALQTVTAGGRTRTVYGTFGLASGAGTASVAIEVETGIGTGVYSRVQTPAAPTGATYAMAYCFSVLSGRRYRFVDLSAGGGVATITDYSFVDNP